MRTCQTSPSCSAVEAILPGTMIPVLWMLAILGLSFSRHTAPYPAFDVTFSSKSQEQKENSTHSSTIGKSSESPTLPSTVNEESVNTTKVHDVNSTTPETTSVSTSAQIHDQWPPPKQNSFQAPTRNISRDPRKLAKDVYTRLAASQDVVAIPVRGQTPQLTTKKTEDVETYKEDDDSFEKNDNLTLSSDFDYDESGVFITPSGKDSVIAGNTVLAASRLTEASNMSFSAQNQTSVDRHDSIVEHEVEKSFLQDEHLVQKLNSQDGGYYGSSESLQIYSPLPTRRDESDMTSDITKSSAHGSTPENDLLADNSLSNRNLSSKGVVISTVEEHEDISTHIITDKKNSATIPTKEISGRRASVPTSSLNTTFLLKEKEGDSSETEGLHVSPVVPSMNDMLTRSYNLKYVETEVKPTAPPSEVSSTSVTSKTQTVRPPRLSETWTAMEKWKGLEKKVRAQSSSLLKKILPKILEHSGRSNISSGCAKAMIQLISGLRALKSWAVKTLDSSGKFPSGSLEGTLTSFGDYDECLNIKMPSRRRDEMMIGKYCVVQLRPILPPLTRSITLNSKVLDFGNSSKDSVFSDLSDASALFHIMLLRIGLCVPSPCSAYDIDQMISMAFQDFPADISVPWCEVKQPVKFSTTQIAITSVMALVGLFVCIGTAIDIITRRRAAASVESGRLKKSFCAFSLISNVSQLLQNSSESNRLGAVNGIRCLSLSWIILAHTYGFGHRQGLARLTDAKHYMEDISFQIISNAWLSVDTFFMLGGLLVANSTLKTMERTGGKIKFIPYALHRIWRLTPPVIAVVGIMFLLPLIGSGPLWPDMVGRKVANCEQRWWQAILPINSWLDFDSACLLHTWYISADIQFYCLAPLALLALYRWPTLGYIVLLLVTSTCSLITGLLTIFYYLPPTIIFFSPNIEMIKKTANLIYFRPYPHMGAYCVGLALGYILWKYPKTTIGWVLQTLGWCMSITSCLAVLLATYPWSRGYMPNPVAGVVYAVVHRTVWAAGIAWLLFMCFTKRAGILNKFLSWNFFAPLSRLCYSMYLLHFPVLWVRVSWRRTLLNFHHYDIVTEFFGILVMTLCLSVLFHLVFEVPFLNLENIWFPRSHQKKMNIEMKQKT